MRPQLIFVIGLVTVHVAFADTMAARRATRKQALASYSAVKTAAEKGDADAIKQLPAARAAVAALPVTEDEVYASAHCGAEQIVCLEQDGTLNPKDHWPRSVRPGDKLTVVVLTPNADDQQHVDVTIAGRKTDEQLFADVVTYQAEMVHEATAGAAPPAENYIAISFTSAAVPDDASEVTVDFDRTDPTTSRTYAIDVSLGYSYVSVALLVAATFKADRHVLRNLDTTSDHAVDPGLALNIFPGGRQRGVIGYLRKCSEVGRCLANTVGVQIGTSLDLSDATNRLYAGVVFEPVAGIALVGGVSLRKVAVVPPSGALPTVELPDSVPPSDQRYVVRGYVGVTLTLDLLTTAAHVGTDLRKLATE